MATLGQNAFQTPTALNQFQAIQNGANKNTLVSQLFAGKPMTAPLTTSTPQVIAAASKVTSPNAPTNTATPFNGGATPNGLFNGASAPVPPNTGYGTNDAPMSVLPPQAPTNQPVTSHSVTDAAGNTTTQKYDTSATNTDANTAPPITPTPTPPSQNNLNTATSGLFNTASGNTALGQAGNAVTQKYEDLINPILRGTTGQEIGDRSTGTQQVGEGNAQLAAAAGGALIQGLTNQENAELAGTGQALTAQSQQANALNQAGALSTPNNQFLQVPYSNQLLDSQGNPVNGGGTTGTLPAAAQSFVNSLATQVQNGQMTRDEATSQLAAYGTAGLQALNTALGSGFNTNASNASAATTATGQQIQTAADSTNKALDTLSSSFSALNGLQTGGIPLTNSIAQWIGSNLGDSALTQYKTNLADARSQLIGVLNSSGGTPTGNESTANQYLPDNMTPAQFTQNVGTVQNPGIVRQLIAQKVASFTGSGSQTNSNASSTNPLGWY